MPLAGNTLLLTSEGLVGMGVQATQGLRCEVAASSKDVASAWGVGVVGAWDQGAYTYVVRLANGCQVQATADHMFRTSTCGYQEVQDLVAGQHKLELQLGHGKWSGGSGTHEEGYAHALQLCNGCGDRCAGWYGIGTRRSDEYVVGLLKGLFAQRGQVDMRNGVFLDVGDARFARHVQQLLFAVGVEASVITEVEEARVRVRSSDGLLAFDDMLGCCFDEAGGDARARMLRALVLDADNAPWGSGVDDNGDEVGGVISSKVVAVEEAGYLHDLYDCVVCDHCCFLANSVVAACR